MNRGTRLLIGLLLLATMSVSLAETVWAASCAPAMGNMAAARLALPPADGMDDMPADHDCMPGHEHRSENGPPCPFTPAGAAPGCTATALLPGRPVAPNTPSFSDATHPPSDDASPHLLRTASIFHPPKT